MKKERGEEGFGLLEMMVVVLIVAVLVGMASATFASASGKAGASRAKTTADLALKTAKAAVVDDFATVTPAVLSTDEEALSFVDGATPSTSADVVSAMPITQPDATSGFVVAVQTTGRDCYLVKEVLGGVREFATVDSADAPSCTAGLHADVAPTAWAPTP